MNKVMFAGQPRVRCVETNEGNWKVQRRNSDRGTDWYDIDGGLFLTKEEAIEGARELCSI